MLNTATMFPVTGQSTAFQVTPLVASPTLLPWPSPRRGRRRLAEVDVAGRRAGGALVDDIVAVTVFPIQLTSTHIPQYFPWPKLPTGNAAK